MKNGRSTRTMNGRIFWWHSGVDSLEAGVMSDWWQSLAGASRIFWCIALGASAFQILLFMGSMLAGHDFHHGHDGGHGDSDNLKLLSIRAVTAFLVGFGWAGALLLSGGTALLPAVLFAMVSGGVFMGVIYLIMRMLVSLRADGTMDYTNAIGCTGHVYFTIPAARSGHGQIEMMLQGRLATIPAVTNSLQPLPPRTPVMVEAVEGQTMLVVSPRFEPQS